MKTHAGIALSVVLVVVLAPSAAFAQSSGTPSDAASTEPVEVAESTEILSLSEEMLQEAESLGTSMLRIGDPVSHYDENGYPETAGGLLALAAHSDGPVVEVLNDPPPYLLYAQYINRQRDAVFLARTGELTDVLPDGSPVPVPFGHGAVKFNTVYVSTIESLLVPHFSDNQKEYTEFPLTDLYVGGGVGFTGALAHVRYVHTERFVAHAAIGYNPFASPAAAGVLNRFFLPVHVGGGYRFAGPIPFIGAVNWTVGGDLMLGLGDRDGDAATPSGVFAPGAFLDIERVLFDDDDVQRDYRTDPRPYNYNVNALVIRAGIYANLSGITDGGWIFPSFSIRYLVNIMGPRIPEHEFKETDVLYVNEIYAEDLREQARRREERANR